jgi:Flp pilus assembly pilin Flp
MQKAQSVTEYGLLIATIVVIVLVGIAAFGGTVEPWFNSLAGRITTAGT